MFRNKLDVDTEPVLGVTPDAMKRNLTRNLEAITAAIASEATNDEEDSDLDLDLLAPVASKMTPECRERLSRSLSQLDPDQRSELAFVFPDVVFSYLTSASFEAVEMVLVDFSRFGEMLEYKRMVAEAETKYKHNFDDSEVRKRE